MKVIFHSLPATLLLSAIVFTLPASAQDSPKIKLAPGALTKTNLPAGAFNPRENTTPPLPFVAGSWTLAVLPDTQVYAMKHAELFDKQTRWIAENKTKHNIAYVLHLGDIVNNNNAAQWKNAQRSMFLLDGHVPYAMAPGNHDFGKNGSSDSRQTFFNDYFPIEKYKKWPTFGGAMEEGKMENTYHTFKAGGQDWLVFALEWGPRNKVTTWCNEVVAKHPNHKLILITHAYMYYDETRYDWKAKGTNQSWNPYRYGTAKDPDGTNDGEDLWNKVVRKHPNFVFAMNGHVIGDGLARMSSVGDHGNVVHQLLVNYQMKYLGGEAFLRLVEFLPDGETVQVKSYSPHYDKYKTDPQNQFVLKLNPKHKGTSAAAAAKNKFDVILLSLPADKKIAVIKALREVKPGLGLAAAKDLVEGAPTPVLQGANKADSEAARKVLEAAGAKVEIK